METSALTFAEPAWFIALAIVPVIAGLYFWSQRRSDALITKVVAPRLRAQLAGAVSVGTRLFKAILVLAAFALIVVALARPQMGYITRDVTQRGRDIIIAVDTSKSMLATDVTPTRLARAKLVAQDFLNLVEGDRVGLIAFAGSAFLQAPLTLDFGAVLNSLDELDTNIIPKGGTNIGAAIRMAEEAFGKGEGSTRVMIILTDGEELDADGIAAARQAKEKGMHIFTLGIGSGEGSLIPIRTDDGTSDFVRDQSGKPVQSRLDETRLREIAEAGGGFYEPMSAESARLIFEKGILPLEATDRDVTASRQPLERYQWPLGAAIALLALWSLLGDRRRMPRAAVAAALVLLAPQAWAQTGLEEYQAGQYDKALADFEKRLETKPDSDKLQFNAGAASYKSGDFAKAVDHFTKALLTEDNKFREQASYNLGNALVRRGEGAKGNEEKKADWNNAIQHYEEALKIDPANKMAEENRDIVKKMLEDLEKQEQEQQQQDQKDQQNQQDQKQDQKQDQQNDQQQNQQNQQNQDQQDQKDQQNQQGQSGQNQDQKDQDQQDQKDQNQQGQSGQNQDQKENQDKQDQAKNDQGQSGDQQDQKDQEKKDQSDQQQGEGKDQDQKDQQDPQKQDGQQGDQDKQDQQKDQGGEQQNDNRQETAQNGQPQNESGQDQQGNQPQAAPEPAGEKKEGDLKASGGQQQQPQGGEQGQAMAASEEEAKDGEMSAAQAAGLLNSVRSEEQRVRLMQPPQNEETLKDW